MNDLDLGVRIGSGSQGNCHRGFWGGTKVGGRGGVQAEPELNASLGLFYTGIFRLYNRMCVIAFNFLFQLCPVPRLHGGGGEGDEVHGRGY
jgi:hypothetical protein